MTTHRKASAKRSIQSKVEKMGWRCVDDHLWEKLGDFKEGIVFLAPPLDTIPSPNGNAIYTIVQELAERAPVPCLVLAAWPQSDEPARCSISNRILYCEKPFQPLLFEKVIPYRIKKMLWGTGRPEIIHYANKAADLSKLLNINTIVIEDIPLYGIFFRRVVKSGTKIFLHQHNNAPLSYKKTWWNEIEHAFNGYIFVANKTLTVTELKHHKLINASVIHNGVDLDYYSPKKWELVSKELKQKHGIEDGELIVLYIGRIIPGKGCLQLIKSFLKAAVPRTKLFIVGNVEDSLYSDGNYSRRILEISKINQNKIILIGSVPQIKIPAWYEIADLVVVPSIESEGLSKVITESLSMGKPVLTTDRGGALELVNPNQNGWLLDNPEDIDMFSETLRKILENREVISNYQYNASVSRKTILDIDYNAKTFFDFILSQTAPKSEGFRIPGKTQ